MPPLLSKAQLRVRLVEAIESAGWKTLFLSPRHPFELWLRGPGESQRIRCYVWNLTHGGYPRSPDELRIQTTGVDAFEITGGVKTLLLGWSEDLRVFAAFDVTKHLVPMRGRSPSHQVRRETLDRARALGLFAQNRANQEVVIGVRPNLLVVYVQTMEALHGCTQETDTQALVRIAEEDWDHPVRDLPASPRETALRVVRLKLRSGRFRSTILDVYGHRCAMSDLQLDLLDAAHIVPVEDDRGTDEIRNGVCLSALHHRAFDSGLVGIRTDYHVITNPRKRDALRRIGWDGGWDTFAQTLRAQINLPKTRDHFPNPEYLVLGQVLRGWREADLRA